MTILDSILASKDQLPIYQFSTRGIVPAAICWEPLMLSHGIPMMLGGDELSMTQEGNNNAYCQDNEITWLNWSLDDRKAEFLAYVRTSSRCETGTLPYAHCAT